MHTLPRTLLRSLLAAVGATLLLTTALVVPASAHDSVSDPPNP
ncbi:hypothetical protein Acor_79290 [Acrocarpospora corrugata]|uniref:Uncharacterized protein n=1 Tax=Acrocarpospora corrugata TaxID=35763 RepID=A0A5M3WC81_9ACTN|nr:hypothetical protein [Acrocarpospora corrugata]GES05860.1 hypothetical protein Acor_79290 [Acrocarpospora corrugata]